MNRAIGDAILEALAAIPELRHTGWASEVAAEDDLVHLSPAAWLQPGGTRQAGEAGRGRAVKYTRTWTVVLTVAGDGRDPLETQMAPLVDAVRQGLTGLDLGRGGFQRLHYAGEPDPFYAPGYLEWPVEFDAPETIGANSHA